MSPEALPLENSPQCRKEGRSGQLNFNVEPPIPLPNVRMLNRQILFVCSLTNAVFLVLFISYVTLPLQTLCKFVRSKGYVKVHLIFMSITK